MEPKQRTKIENASNHSIDCTGNCYYCRKIGKIKKEESFNMKIVFAYDEPSVLL